MIAGHYAQYNDYYLQNSVTSTGFWEICRNNLHKYSVEVKVSFILPQLSIYKGEVVLLPCPNHINQGHIKLLSPTFLLWTENLVPLNNWGKQCTQESCLFSFLVPMSLPEVTVLCLGHVTIKEHILFRHLQRSLHEKKKKHKVFLWRFKGKILVPLK